MLLELVTGGFETTQHLIESLLDHVCDRPELWARLRAERELVPKAIEEMLRFRSPTQALGRRPVEEVELHGDADPGRQLGHRRLRLGEPRRARVPRSGHVRRRPRAAAARRLQRRRPLLPGRARLAGGDPDPARRAARPLRLCRARRPLRAEREPDAGEGRQDPRLGACPRAVRAVTRSGRSTWESSTASP